MFIINLFSILYNSPIVNSSMKFNPKCINRKLTNIKFLICYKTILWIILPPLAWAGLAACKMNQHLVAISR